MTRSIISSNSANPEDYRFVEAQINIVNQLLLNTFSALIFAAFSWSKRFRKEYRANCATAKISEYELGLV